MICCYVSRLSIKLESPQFSGPLPTCPYISTKVKKNVKDYFFQSWLVSDLYLVCTLIPFIAQLFRSWTNANTSQNKTFNSYDLELCPITFALKHDLDIIIITWIQEMKLLGQGVEKLKSKQIHRQPRKHYLPAFASGNNCFHKSNEVIISMKNCKNNEMHLTESF